MLILFTNCKKSNYTKTSYQNLFSTLIDLVTHFAIVINPELLSNSHPKSNQGERVEEFPIKDKHRIEWKIVKLKGSCCWQYSRNLSYSTEASIRWNGIEYFYDTTQSSKLQCFFPTINLSRTRPHLERAFTSPHTHSSITQNHSNDVIFADVIYYHQKGRHERSIVQGRVWRRLKWMRVKGESRKMKKT